MAADQNSSRPASTADPLHSPTRPRATLNTSSAVSSTTATPSQTPRREASLNPSPSVSHRSSFAENLRNPPIFSRAHRNPSFSGQALTDLLMSPPVKSNGEDASKLQGRDWRTIQVHEIIDAEETRFVELDTSIEDTTKLLVRSGAPNVVLVRESSKTRSAIGMFGYDELNAYLLLVLGMWQADGQAAELAKRARAGETLLLKQVTDHLGPTEQPAFLPHTANLTHAITLLGSGKHRILVCKEGTSEAVGVLSQLRLVRFFWENHRSFTVMERLYSFSLKELAIGAKEVVAINGDKPLSDALRLMHEEGITSLPVLDSHNNVVGNISHVDVRLLTDTSSIPLLSQTCIHFISVILAERGLEDGKDSYPVFHITPYSTLAHTVAKLVATRSHRMWLVDAPSPSNSIPPSPGVHHATPSLSNAQRTTLTTESVPTTPSVAGFGGTAVSASQLPNTGANMSGRLTGVVSLTDVLNLLARASGLSPTDPEESRRRRRRSSSASSSQRGQVDSVRASAEYLRNSGELRRSGSASRR